MISGIFRFSKKAKVFLSVAFLSAGLCFSQNRSDSFLNNYVSSVWTTAQGLPGNSVNDIVQDSNGYIYIGTYDGLVRFDGIEFDVLNRKFDPKYDFISTRSLFLDSDGNMWNGSNDEGVFCIQKDGNVLKFNTENGLPNNSVRAICEDHEKNIWIGTSSGVVYIDSQRNVHIPKGIYDVSPKNKVLVKHLYCDTAGRIWLTTAKENQLLIFQDGHFSVYPGITSIENPVVNVVSQDSSGAFWFGVSPHHAIRKTENEEVLYDIGNGIQKGTVVNDIFQDSSGNIWFALDNGITIFHEGQFSYYDEKYGLTDEKVAQIMEDREGNIWIGTDRGGVEKLSKTQFTVIPVPTTVNAIAEDTFRNVYWFAGDNGLYCYDFKKFITNEITEYCKNIRIRDVSVCKDGSLLVSTYEKLGQLMFKLDGSVISWTKDTGLTGNRTRVALLHSNGDLYVATTNGLNIIHKARANGEIKQITKADGVSNDFIMALYEDKDGSVWCGTDGGGVFVVNPNSFKVEKILNSENGLIGNVVFKIENVVSDEIWISTGSGLTRIKDGKIYSYNSENGLGTSGVFQAVSDYLQNIWFTKNRGISSAKMKNFEKVERGEKGDIDMRSYGRSDGLITGGITSTSKSIRDSKGKLLFTLIDGVAVYDPVRTSSSSKEPIVQIKEISVDNEKVDFSSGKIVIPPSGKRLSFKFTGLCFTSSEQVTFSYRLEGFDSEFTEWESNRTVSYTNLPYGTYKFSVFAQTREEVKSEMSRTITIVKKPYLYEMNWFWIFIALVFASLVFAVLRHRFNSIRREKENAKRFMTEVITALAGTIDAKDSYTKGHSSRVAEYARMIAEKAGKIGEELNLVYYTSLLHDIGKIGIPDNIINKPSKLTDEEYSVIKTHPVIGSEILKSIKSFSEISIGAKWHHERYDGKGYPDGLKGDEIPEIARIIGVADAYDAMSSHRSYRHALPQAVCREQIEGGIGTQFDPKFAKIMLEIIDGDKDYKFREME